MNRIAFRLGVFLLGGAALALTLMLTATAFGGETAEAGVIYVAPGGSCGGAPLCYADVQSALDSASPGDEIRVAAGTYTGVQTMPQLNTAHFTATQLVAITKDVEIRGGYTPADWSLSDPAANPTILDAEGQGRVLIVVGDVSASLRGLQLVNGNSGGLGGRFHSWQGEVRSVGGGAYIVTASVTLDSCDIANNLSPLDGGYAGGVYAVNASVHLLDSVVSGNEGGCTGGVWLNESTGSRVLRNSFVDNRGGGGNCYTGGALFALGSDIRVEENVFTDNYGYGGGALGIEGDARVTRNTLVNNRSIYGGGLHIGSGTPVLDSNLIAGNEARQAGGGVSMFNVYPGSQPLLTNNVIADNHVDAPFGGGRGTGMFVGGGDPTLVHTTFARNTGGDGSGLAVDPFVGDSTVVMTNTILVSHTVGISITSGNSATLDGVLWHQTPTTVYQETGADVVVEHAVTGDPAFAGDGYHILATSAALDRGVGSDLKSDVDGDVRWFGAAPDLGADERATAETTAEPSEPTVLSAAASGMTTTIEIPTGAVSQTTDFVYTARAEPDYEDPARYSFAGRAFSLEAYRNGEAVAALAFDEPVMVTIHYTEAALGTAREDGLTLMSWNGEAWEDAACGEYDRRPALNWLEVPICHLSEFGLFGRVNNVYLPVVLGNR